MPKPKPLQDELAERRRRRAGGTGTSSRHPSLALDEPELLAAMHVLAMRLRDGSMPDTPGIRSSLTVLRDEGTRWLEDRSSRGWRRKAARAGTLERDGSSN